MSVGRSGGKQGVQCSISDRIEVQREQVVAREMARAARGWRGRYWPLLGREGGMTDGGEGSVWPRLFRVRATSAGVQWRGVQMLMVYIGDLYFWHFSSVCSVKFCMGVG